MEDKVPSSYTGVRAAQFNRWASAMRTTTTALYVAAVAIAFCIIGCERQSKDSLLVKFECKFRDKDWPLPIVVNLGKMNGMVVTGPDTLIRMHLSGVEDQLVLSFDAQSEAPPKVWIRTDGSAMLRENWSTPGKIGEQTGICTRI